MRSTLEAGGSSFGDCQIASLYPTVRTRDLSAKVQDSSILPFTDHALSHTQTHTDTHRVAREGFDWR